MKNISILGGGWLGFPLGKELAKQHQIKMSSTSQNKLKIYADAGLQPFLLNILPNESSTFDSMFFEECDLLIITIPPNRRNSESLDYVKKMDWIISQIEKHDIKEVIFTSSTSVYDGLINEVDELSHLLNETNEIVVNELKLLHSKTFNAAVLRLGGLFGNERHPVYYLVKKKVIENGNEPVNMLHLNDAINAIKRIVSKPIPNSIYNLVYPKHDSRETFYTNAAKRLNLILPPFIYSEVSKNRKVMSEKIQNDYNFEFQFFE